MSNKIKIGLHEVGDNSPTYFIADIAANHDGSIKRAIKLVRLAKRQEQMLLSFSILKLKQ